MQQDTRLPHSCLDCDTEIPANRKRCEPCAYAARLADNLARYHRNSTTGQDKPCERCGKDFTPARRGPTRYCDPCRHAQHLESQRASRARNPKPPAPTTRPCPTCGKPMPRSGKVFPRFCGEDCKPRCQAPGCDRPFKYKTEAGLLCPKDYVRWSANGSFETRWEWESDPGSCRQCGIDMPEPIPGMGWICSSRCHGRRRLKIDESETWPCAQCSVLIDRKSYRSDAKLCLLCRRSRRPALSAHQLAERDGIECALCGDDVDLTLSGMAYWGPTADHRMPVSKGGPDVPENLQLAHRICNIRKLDHIVFTG